MSEKKGYDPFSDDEAVTAGETKPPVAKDDPMEELMTPSGVVPSVDSSSRTDGWAPVEEEAWELPEPVPDLESLIQDDPDAVEPTEAISATTSGVYREPERRNPLPEADPVFTESAAIRAERPAGVRHEAPAADSNEAILQSGVISGVQDAARKALPSQSDAPSPPAGDLVGSRPTAWVLPVLVFVGGVGAGVYVLVGHNPILGGIAIAMSFVGSLFLRVFLKQ